MRSMDRRYCIVGNCDLPSFHCYYLIMMMYFFSIYNHKIMMMTEETMRE